jgi:Na+/H+ antiporter NhaD/arsenite permease-like protein
MISTLIIIFIVGYLFIIFERNVNVDKAAFSLLTGVSCWVYLILNSNDKEIINHQLTEGLGEISGILFFLLAAMTIVELIDAHNGFDIITKFIKTTNKRNLLWLISFITFFSSAILDNLTTAIVMTTLVQKIVTDQKDKWLLLGVVVIASNAGGAWSPIGDVTTTMLWINHKISALGVIKQVIFPSLICMIVPVTLLSFFFKGKFEKPILNEQFNYSLKERNLIFIVGLLCLVSIPVFKQATHLPPYMGILAGLGFLWIVTEFIHRKKDQHLKERFSIMNAIQKTDVKSILFFLGILLAIKPLEITGVLNNLANQLGLLFNHNTNSVVFSIGLISSIVDNVPLVAAGLSMFDFPVDHPFWHFMAYATGTGGSCLIIGSAAGVAVMGLENISFGWYFKRISLLAIVGYLSGALFFML